MPKRRFRSDHTAGEALRRIETQMRLEGRLEKADAVEGAAILLAPLVLGAVFLVGWVLTALGLEGPAMVMLGVPLLFGAGALVLWLADRR